jgi:hypothetical protein
MVGADGTKRDKAVELKMLASPWRMAGRRVRP